MSVVITESRWRKIEEALKMIVTIHEEWITEYEARRLLGGEKPISQGGIYNMIRHGKITSDMYRVGVGSNRFYNKQKLMGLI